MVHIAPFEMVAWVGVNAHGVKHGIRQEVITFPLPQLGEMCTVIVYLALKVFPKALRR